MLKIYKISQSVEFMIDNGYLNIPTLSLIFTKKYTTIISIEFRKWISVGASVDNFSTLNDNQIALLLPFSVFSITWYKTGK